MLRRADRPNEQEIVKFPSPNCTSHFLHLDRTRLERRDIARQGFTVLVATEVVRCNRGREAVIREVTGRTRFADAWIESLGVA